MAHANIVVKHTLEDNKIAVHMEHSVESVK